MSDLLAHFDFDIFLSYGWSGLPDENVGDRAWVAAFKESLHNELSGVLGRQPRIFFDINEPVTDIDHRLREAAASSVLFLSVMTPGACRADSWCRKEIEYFLSDADTSLFSREQIFVARIREVPESQWPPSLAGVAAAVDFLTPSGLQLPAPPPRDPAATESGRLVQRLARKMTSLLQKAERAIAQTVVLVYSPSAPLAHIDRLSIEAAARGSRVIRLTLRDGESETVFRARVHRALMSAAVSIHCLSDRDDVIPDGWSDSPQNLQLAAAGRRFRDNQGLILWQQSATAPLPLELAAQSRPTDLRGMPFENFESVVKQTVADAFKRVVEPVEPEEGESSDGSQSECGRPIRYLFLNCVKKDLANLTSVRSWLKHYGVVVRVPFFTGDEARRRRYTRQAMDESHGVAVYFGSGRETNAYAACEQICTDLTGRQGVVPKVVMLDPADDPTRQFFVHPEFSNWDVPRSRTGSDGVPEREIQQILQLLGWARP
jgi:hypothetical protein